jgi:hypothetical protein
LGSTNSSVMVSKAGPLGPALFIAARSLNEPVGGDTTGHSVFVFPLVGLAVLEFTVEKDLIGIGKGQLVE